MKYIKYAFLGLISLGFLGAIGGMIGVSALINHYSRDLPDYSQLKDYEPPIVTRVYAGDGRLVEEFAQEKRVFVPIESMPAMVKQAFIAAEDKNFYNHEGVDLTAIARAAVSNLKNAGSDRRPIGASTITQQVAKNFLLTNEVSYARKMKEAILAYRMEKVMSKDRLLELYLNEIYLGSRAYGVAAAALQYFGKSLEELTVAQAAYLAALPKAPNNYHPIRKKEAAIERRNWVIDRMYEDGYISQGQKELAQLEPLEVIPQDATRAVKAPYFAEEIRRQLIKQYGDDSLYGGGLVVRSTVEPMLQEAAERALQDGLMSYDKRHGWRGPVENIGAASDWKEKLSAVKRPDAMLSTWKMAVVLTASAPSASLGFADGSKGTLKLEQAKWARKSLQEGYALGPEITGVNQVVNVGDVILVEPVEKSEGNYHLRQIPLLQGAIMAMDPHTGRVLAMQGGWKYGISEYNRATQAKRQPGSAFKPFVYLAALEKGFTPATLVQDAPFVMEDRPGHFWSPVNYSGDFLGPTPIRVGVEKSKNLMTVRLANHLGMDYVASYAEKLGIFDSMPRLLSYSLGAGETTLLKMTSAYAMLVNGGKKVVPTFVDRIQDRRGSTVFQHDNRECINCGPLMKWLGQEVPDVPDTREQLVDPRTAYQMVSILEGVVQRGTAVKLKQLGRPLAGKTGTTNESKDTWFMGFSPDLVVGVYMGFDNPRSLGKRETGSSVAIPVFKDFMATALKDQPLLPFRIPPGIKNVKINPHNGQRASAGETDAIWEAFLPGTEPQAGNAGYVLTDDNSSLPPPNAAGEETEIIPEPTQDSISGTGGLY